MKRWLSAIFAAVLLVLLIPDAAAAAPSEFDSLQGALTSNTSVSVKHSVVDAAITFTNVTAPGECTLRWYLDDVLCAEDPHFLLEEGSGASMQCSLHFGDRTGEAAALWVEILSNDNDSLRARFSRRIFIRDFTQPQQWVDSGEYLIHVIRNKCVVVVYQRDGNGEYTRIANAFVCSPGLYEWTITGWYGAYGRWDWLDLMGGVSGQYATQIYSDWLFHSVPYLGRHKDQLELEEYNHLGEKASAGCIRMAVSDTKWIYDHCPSGTRVYLYDSDTVPVVKPIPIHLNGETFTGWDPTDPDPANATRPKYFPGYDIPLRPAGGACSLLRAH